MKLRLVVLAGALLFPAIAVAQSTQGPYVSGDLGVNVDGSLLSSKKMTKLYTDAGETGLAALGWKFGNGFRTEIEGSYRSNGVDGVSTRRTNGLLEPLTGVGGDAATYAVMTNVAYEIPVHPLGLPLRPYVGAGLGYAWLDPTNVRGTGFGVFSLPQQNTFTGLDAVRFGQAGAFAYQAIVGASLPLHVLPGLELTANYRFFGTAVAYVPINRTALGGDTVNGVVPSNATRDRFETHANTVLIGVRYRFGAS
jgi:OmpA-OmpF porin, OOP family